MHVCANIKLELVKKIQQILPALPKSKGRYLSDSSAFAFKAAARSMPFDL